MPICQCGATLEGRRRKCDACKVRPGQDASPTSEPQAPEAPAGLHARGAQLWSDLGLALNTPAGQIALEACRLADRLDELDSVIAGKGVLNLMSFRVKDVFSDTDSRDISIEVKFQAVLAEARQQQQTFRALLSEIQGQVTATSVPAPTPTAGVSSPLDELARRRGSASKQ